jgi:hypothetical protein
VLIVAGIPGIRMESESKEESILESNCDDLALQIPLTRITYPEFRSEFPFYPDLSINTFHILRDLLLKREVGNIKLRKMQGLEMQSYVIECKILPENITRYLIPWKLENEIDLLWYDFCWYLMLNGLFHITECFYRYLFWQVKQVVEDLEFSEN